MRASYILLKEVNSTNQFLSQMAATLPSGTVVYTHNQLIGRGQRGNAWESAPGENITMSALIKGCNIPAKDQFYISEAVSIAILEVLKRYDEDFKIKWPNDIYHKDKKICGILIENSLCGTEIQHSIIGVGLNVNQNNFLSDAPNPISLSQITDTRHDVEALIREVGNNIILRCAQLSLSNVADLHEEYKQDLYRADGEFHSFTLPDGVKLSAKIDDVMPSGRLILSDIDNLKTDYAFKEVTFDLQ